MNFRNFKKALLVTSATGSVMGFTLGLLYANRMMVVCFKKVDQTKYNTFVLRNFEAIPLSCIACACFVPLTIACTPLALADFFGNTCFLDRLVDDIDERFTVEFRRYHQFDGHDYKYFAPSHVFIKIDSRK